MLSSISIALTCVNVAFLTSFVVPRAYRAIRKVYFLHKILGASIVRSIVFASTLVVPWSSRVELPQCMLIPLRAGEWELSAYIEGSVFKAVLVKEPASHQVRRATMIDGTDVTAAVKPYFTFSCRDFSRDSIGCTKGITIEFNNTTISPDAVHLVTKYD